MEKSQLTMLTIVLGIVLFFSSLGLCAEPAPYILGFTGIEKSRQEVLGGDNEPEQNQRGKANSGRSCTVCKGSSLLVCLVRAVLIPA